MSASLPSSEVSFHSLARSVREALTSHLPFALQVGAMDGVKFDLLHPHLANGEWSGLLIEPVPDMFAKLKIAYSACASLQFENCAVADFNGVLTLRRIDPAAVEKGLIPEEALGITSSFVERSLCSHPNFAKAYPDVARNYISDLVVPCFRLDHLLVKHRVENISLVVIDTEGADWLIARQLDLLRFHPAVICLEYTSLPEGEINECCHHFNAQGYSMALCAEDRQNLIFYKKDLF